MNKKQVAVSIALTTTLAPEKAARMADECGVQLTLVEIRMGNGRRWFNDFEVEGGAGKVDAFLERVRDLELP